MHGPQPVLGFRFGKCAYLTDFFACRRIVEGTAAGARRLHPRRAALRAAPDAFQRGAIAGAGGRSSSRSARGSRTSATISATRPRNARLPKRAASLRRTEIRGGNLMAHCARLFRRKNGCALWRESPEALRGHHREFRRHAPRPSGNSSQGDPEKRAFKGIQLAAVLTLFPHPLRVLRPSRGPGAADDHRAAAGMLSTTRESTRRWCCPSTWRFPNCVPKISREAIWWKLHARAAKCWSEKTFRFGHRQERGKVRSLLLWQGLGTSKWKA
jgi:hypothetical protein